MLSKKRIAFAMIVFTAGAAHGMATWIKCVITYSPCMTMLDGSTGYCEEEECKGVPYWYDG